MDPSSTPISDEAHYRRQIDYIFKAFTEEQMPTVAAAVCLTCLFPIGGQDEETAYRSAMTLVLQDLAEFPDRREKIAGWLVNRVLDTWHEIRTGEEVMAAAEALQSRGHVVAFDPEARSRSTAEAPIRAMTFWTRHRACKPLCLSGSAPPV
jgi:hypothetical protein